MNHLVQPFIPLRDGTYKGHLEAQRMSVGYHDYVVQVPPQDDVPQHYIGSHEYTWFQQHAAFPHHSSLLRDNDLQHFDVRVFTRSQQQMPAASVQQLDSGTQKGLVVPTVALDTAGSRPKMPRPKAGRLAIKPDSLTVATAESQPAFQPIPEAIEPKPTEQQPHPKIRDWASVLRAPPRVDIPQHYIGEYTRFQWPNVSPYHANLPQDDTAGRGQQPTSPPHLAISGSLQHSKPQLYRGRYIGSLEYPKSQQRSNPLQHRGSQWNGGWGQVKRPEPGEPRSPVVRSFDPLPATTSYVTPVNFFEPVPEARLPVVPSVASSVPMIPPGDFDGEPIVSQLTGSQYPGSLQHTGSSSYAGWGRMKRPESSEPRSPFVPPLDHMPASTPYVPPVSLVSEDMTPNLPSRSGTAEPWAHAPQDFQLPTLQAGAAAVAHASPRTAVSVFSRGFGTPPTIFEPISSDHSSIYSPDSPDEDFQSLSGTSPNPRYENLPEDEVDDGEEPAPYVPYTTGGSASGFVPPAVRHTTGDSSSGFVPPGVPRATGTSSSAFTPLIIITHATGNSSSTSIPPDVPMSMGSSLPSFVPGVQGVQTAVRSVTPNFTGYRQAQHKIRRVTVESITDEDEPKVVPVTAPREPTPPTPPSLPQPARKDKGER